MNKEIKEKWVEALRSGKYKQGRYQLKNSRNEYCCLGVLCDLAVKENVVREEDLCFNGESQFLPKEILQWAGLKRKHPTSSSGIVLSLLNDSDCYDFKMLADLIERDL